MEEEKYDLNQNSFIPSLIECERFIKWSSDRNDLNLSGEEYVLTINKAGLNVVGYMRHKESLNGYTNEGKKIFNINLNTIHLKTYCPYECLTHELAHLINAIGDIKDCSSNQYHNKYFKSKAESLGLKVERGIKGGYNRTSLGEELRTAIEEDFKPNRKVWELIQTTAKKGKKKPQLNALFECGCGIKTRSSNREFRALCLNCDTEFMKVEI